MGNHLPLQRGCLNFGKFCLKKSVRNRHGEGLFHRLPPAWAKAPRCQPVRGWSCGFSLSFRGFHLDSFLSFHPYQLPFPPEKASEGGDLSPLEWDAGCHFSIPEEAGAKLGIQASGKGPLGSASCLAKLFQRQDPFWLCNISTLTLSAGARGRGHGTGPERPTSFTQVENNATEMWSKVSLSSTGSLLKLLIFSPQSLEQLRNRYASPLPPTSHGNLLFIDCDCI